MAQRSSSWRGSFGCWNGVSDTQAKRRHPGRGRPISRVGRRVSPSRGERHGLCFGPGATGGRPNIMFPYLLWILFGGIVGWASTLLRGRGSAGHPTINVAAGVIGATIGGCAHDRVSPEASIVSPISLFFVLVAATAFVAVALLVQQHRAKLAGARCSREAHPSVASAHPEVCQPWSTQRTRT